ncbi:hypothetical protein SYJ56_19295 [Algoriphagus sp. D3-2-R+10]|uniref:hypothetical protein n=1 Tax=Algoriphagus aurantiacus TaxID=3103948 RepID=UPI002B39BEE0|nr:hypothetical protein [Algoriphagus sp. D3-2-R+10]MEB2777469.1 hypothetical protein [Algoriphagus sp. D3-2-R+10]
MTNQQGSKVNWDLILKAIGLLLTLATILVGVWKYTDEQASQHEMEFKREIWQKQLNAYTEACKYSGLIANRPEVNFEENVGNFGALYWGEMIMIEDEEVRDAMKEFYYALHDYHPQDKNSQYKLKVKADALAKACRESSKRSWISEQLLK